MARAVKNGGKSLAQQIADTVGAGKNVAVETVDFNDPNRPPTCLEVDFPLLPINQIAQIEGNAGKPIYQMSKWWARRRSSVFRAMLLAAAMKAPEDPAQAAKAVWDVYYANHQKKGALSRLKVADIFMGGGTTLVEGSRLGMQMWGTDLNPVAWFVVKNEFAKVTKEEVEALLADIEAEVKPKIMPFYACECPRGHKGKWTHVSTGKVMGKGFDPLTLTPEQRLDYSYEGPEIIYVFWAKHGPCQVTGCGHRTPIMSSPVMAVKTLSVKTWEDYECPRCHKPFDIEAAEARMAPGVPLVVAAGEKPFAILDTTRGAVCPHCKHRIEPSLGKGKNKKIDLTLLVHPFWLKGSPKVGPDGQDYGGSSQDGPGPITAWNRERARSMRLVEVRGALPAEITCPATKITFSTNKGTVPRKSHYACGACGTVQDVLETVKRSGKTGPVAAYAIQGYCPACDRESRPYGGRFFSPATDTSAFDAAVHEWASRNETDLKDYWPRSELPYGFMTHLLNGGIPNHGFTHWWRMFNSRQLLGHTQLLRSIVRVGGPPHRWEAREYVLGAFQQYLRNQCMLSFWHMTYDKLAPALSNPNFHPKSTVIEVGVFSPMGYGPWSSTFEALFKGLQWRKDPWELVSTEWLDATTPTIANGLTGKSSKVLCGDPPILSAHEVVSVSATDLVSLANGSFDLVITDPPFGGLLHYSELSDFFYVWLRLVLKAQYPDNFTAEYTPKALEVVSNRAREPENPDGFYKRLLTQCWREAHRILKPGGLLCFTFHHSEDAPWVAVLESLFDTGFYLEATYPIRSDETKGEGEFGSKQIEYDIIHVCRKRTEEPKPVSWARMRREVLDDVQQLKSLLEHHAKAGLLPADLQVIKRGKALEYFSRHYGKVYVDEGREFTVRDALLGINQLLDEESGKAKQPPPVTAEPFTRQFLRIFEGCTEQPRDQMQKFLKGTGIAPNEFADRGWCREEGKVYHLGSPRDIAQTWHGRRRQGMTADYDQAMFLIGACFENSGINAADTLKNENFRPHPALAALLEWHIKRGATNEIRNAATRAQVIYQTWARTNREKLVQLEMQFGDKGE
jgi:DNA-directed RNA polymerase subunit RPC12/RpoP